jgi:GTP-binding protein EngB required for normal cell division/uncharacterized protein (DUF697 family)
MLLLVLRYNTNMKSDLKAALQKIWDEYEKSKKDPVKIGLLGQPGAGKSSLINSIVGHPVAPVGVETDYTKGAVPYAWNEITLVDLPGYGTENFPREGFLDKFEILKFDALLCVSDNKFRSDDLFFFREVIAHKKHCIFVRTHLSSLAQPGKTKDELKVKIRADLAEKLKTDQFSLVFVDNITQEGMAALQDLIARLLAPARRAQFFRWAHGTSDSFLKQKRESCNTMIRWFAAGAAANGLNPIPGGDIAVDLAIVGKMYTDILNAFGFTRELLQDYMDRHEMLRPLLAPVLAALVRGAAALLTAFAGSAAAKWVPFIGPAIAASAAATIVYAAGHSFADQCLKISFSVRDAELRANGTI